jgi:transcriptional regulator with XRE-family HTH domain
MDNAVKEKSIGWKISRVRLLKGVKQESLAIDIGVSQQEISHIEQLENIDEELLNKIAAALKVTPETIKNFDENLAIFNINNNVQNNTFTESSTAIHQVFNPIEKIIELYERLLESEREKTRLFTGK